MKDKEESIRLTIEVTDERVHDLLFGHSGRYSDWLCQIDDQPAKAMEGAYASVWYDVEEGPEGNGAGFKKVTKEDVAKGLSLMITECPYTFARWMSEDDDDVDFDNAWQFIIFGKLVYG